MLSKRVVVVLFCLCTLLWIGSPVAMGQSSSTGIVTGTVTDSTGAAAPDAVVTLTDVGTSTPRTTNTNDKGYYTFSYVNPGTYSLKIAKQGFKTTVVSNQVVQVGIQLTVNAVLELGSISQTVEVTVTVGAELQTMDATVGANLSGETLTNLPNTSRDASTLAVLQPGQNLNGNVGGAASDQNTFQLDGGYATDDMSGDNNTYIKGFGGDTAGGAGAYHSSGNGQAPSAVVPIPVTSVEEFKVSTANQTADFSGGAGSQVQIVTKRGTNTLHGGVYEYYLDNNFGGANTWDNNSTGRKQPSAHFSRFGADAGGRIPKVNFLGGAWYLFGNYEGYRNPASATFTRNFPTEALRAGLIQLNGEVINLNPVATVFPGTGTSYAANSATCVAAAGCKSGTIPKGTVIPCTGVGGCDPRGLGMNPVISTLWNTYLPLPNNCAQGDGLNYCGYQATIQTPQSSNFGVARIDHDFAKGWHFNGSYHYYKLKNTVSDQWDVGGFFPGDTKGQYAAIRSKPQNTWLYTAGLTKDIRPGLTNDFHFSFTRNWWAYADPSGVPNVAGYPAALEIGGETSGVFGPYNTNNQSTRTRYWNGHDSMYKDDVTWVKGNHLFQFGGMYLRNNDTHKRNDNGQSINTFQQYLVGMGNAVSLSSVGISVCGSAATCYRPDGITSTSKYGNLYSMVLGMVDSTQGLFTRGLSTPAGLPLNPITSCAIPSIAATADCMSSPAVAADSIIPTYSIYLSDSWRVKPKFTVNYGIGYTVQMPPYETLGGFQTVMVDQNNRIFSGEDYLNNVKQAALQGQAYAPAVGFTTVRNVQGHSKYPYDPFYGGISPRIGIAWNVRPNTVIRGGYAIIYGRINGVNPLLVPLLTPGLLQPDTCGGPGAPSIVGNNTTCGGTTPANVFRVGVDCPAAGSCVAPLPAPVQNLPQPWYPGVNQIATGSGETFDSNFKPNKSDEFTFTIQRQISARILAEAGYIGRRITHEVEYYSLTAVPYMMTLGGQSFANAWKEVMVATNYGTNTASIPLQPFFEAALKPGYCAGFANCTTAFVMNNLGNMSVSDAFDAWASVSNKGNFVFGRTMQSDPINTAFGANGQTPSLLTTISNGYGNYNAGFLQLTATNWHGLTMKTNFTWSKALGTGNVVQASSSYANVDPWNQHNMYGPQYYDEKFNLNIFFNYAPPFYSSQKGVLGHVLGGWSISPLFVYGSGFPVQVQTPNGNCGSLGECNTAYVGSYENMIVGNNLNYSATRKAASGSVCGNSGAGFNVLSNPDASCPVNGGIFGDAVRAPILGLDGQIGGGGPVRGLPFWNLDLGLSKRLKITERFSSSLHFDFGNVANHMQAADPCFTGFDTSTWGVLGCGGNLQANTPRRFQIGVTIDW